MLRFCNTCGEGVTTFCRAHKNYSSPCAMGLPRPKYPPSVSPFPVVNGERTKASLDLMKQNLVDRGVNKSLSFQRFHDILPDIDKFEEGTF